MLHLDKHHHLHADHGCGMTMQDHGGGGTTSYRHDIDGDNDFIMIDDFVENADSDSDDEDGEVALMTF